MPATFHRRQLLGAAIASLAAPAIAAEEPWGAPVIDIHFHPRTGGSQEVDHLAGSGCSRAVLLPGRDREERARDLAQHDPKRFVRFTSSDPSQPGMLDHLRAGVESGAIGFGELKFAGMLDSPEARRIYELAAELHVPVLIHFQEDLSFSGFARLPAILKEYKRTTFIGHANSWWSYISSADDNKAGYPTGRIKPGGLTDRMLADYPNVYGDLSANSGRNAMARDPDFAASFLVRHRAKLMFGSDCDCQDGHGTGQKQSTLKGKCTARETLTLLKGMSSPELLRSITWDNATRLLKI